MATRRKRPSGKGTPAGYNTAMPYLRVRGADKAIAFYRRAFGAREKFRLMMPGKKIGHAEIRIGDATIMLSEEFPEVGAIGPDTLKGTSVTISLYVADVDGTIAAAKRAGAKVIQKPADQFYGDRTARIVDPFGHSWSIQQRLFDVTPRQMQKQLDALMALPAKAAKAPRAVKRSKQAPRAKRRAATAVKPARRGAVPRPAPRRSGTRRPTARAANATRRLVRRTTRRR